MKLSVLSWLILVEAILAFNVASLVYGQCLHDQRVLLLRLRNSLNFTPVSSTKLVRWNRADDCCGWNGVKCDEKGRVVGLNLSAESIGGSIDDSSSLFDLKYLQILDLSLNNFGYSQIPSRIGKLANLAHLNFSNSGFVGQIPLELSDLTRLVTLDLSAMFTGNRSLKLESPNLASLVGNLGELEELYLDGVNISAKGKEWCEALSSSLPNLRVLSMSNCYLSGPIDPSLLKLEFLENIRLDNNEFSTSVPDFFGKFRNLVSLRLSHCGFSGKLPGKVFQLATLQTLDLSHNELLEGSVGDFPENGSLQTLVLSYTRFSGRLPESIGNLDQLSRIDLAACNFTGPIPMSIAKLEQLVYVDFSLNQFNGTLPSFAMSKNLTRITVSHNGFTGELPAHWESLEKLQSLDVSDNTLSGRIPLSLFSLPSLQNIQLSDNRFSGQLNIPSNVTFSNLNTLDLSSNNLQGPISTSVMELRGLNILSLASNKFSGSVNLEWFQKLTNLTSLDLSYNNLSITGTGNSLLPQLRTLKLASCGLETFPVLRNQSRLTFLDLSDNRISGKVPSWIWKVGNGSLIYLNISHNLLLDFEEDYKIPVLSALDLHSNMFSGKLPPLPPSASYLDYSSNNFTSSIPVDINSSLSFAIYLSLSNNSLTGSIPESVCDAPYLRVLDLSKNELSGNVPECLFSMSTTRGVLNLRGNNLNGSLADAFPRNCAIETLDLSSNHIEGRVPRSLANCSNLQVLNFGNNQISDIFPCHLKNLSNLRVMVLRSNRFFGSIDCSEYHNPWPMLQIVDLAFNNFSGELYQDCLKTWKAMMGDGNGTAAYLQFDFLEFSRFSYYQDTVTVTAKGLELQFSKILTIYTAIDLSSNNFEGPIPDTMGEFSKLYVLNLSHNAFAGPIPSRFGNLKQLESLDLSSNNLTGEIPGELANLSFLSFLNLSSNQLVGPIPKRDQFLTFSEESFEGNKGLCGTPLKEKCGDTGKSEEQQPTSASRIKNPENELDWQFIFTGIGYGVGAGAVVAPIVFSRQASDCLDDGVDTILLVILPMVGLTYTTSDNWGAEDEESLEDDEMGTLDEDTEDENEEKDGEFYRKYCLFCTKLDITRKIAIHNPKCKCHHDSPTSSSSSFASSFSLSQ